MEKAEKNMTEMPRLLAEAMYLADSYSDALRTREQLAARLAGDWTYTIDMAISDLDSITVGYDGERVQSSNISNPTERIAMKLTDEYMARKQWEMDAERAACAKELEYVSWKINVVETVIRERLDSLQKNVFRLIFKEHRKYKEVKAALGEKQSVNLDNRGIFKVKEQIWERLIRELEFRSAFSQNEDYEDYMTRLTAEAAEWTGKEGK